MLEYCLSVSNSSQCRHLRNGTTRHRATRITFPSKQNTTTILDTGPSEATPTHSSSAAPGAWRHSLLRPQALWHLRQPTVSFPTRHSRRIDSRIPSDYAELSRSTLLPLSSEMRGRRYSSRSDLIVEYMPSSMSRIFYRL
ncbi:Protein of unknown function [Pyronema omphalodes CBS 100304]|uniref:Uncharacterized protein n=1 Tax=Pyronema omphalodes (strain CBS 100304) TaxID=1076935 RepID=U4LDP8_PYROM|nr:Protein of unknown function [Pyronema omphalodes CBS 100304]